MLGDNHPRRFGKPVVGHIQPAQDLGFVDERMQPNAFLGLQHGALDSPGGGPALPTMQLSEALGGGGHFQTAELVETPFAVEIDAGELFDRVSGQLRHRLRTSGLKDQTRCVRRRASRQRQRPLVHHGDPIPAAGGELVGQVGANNAGADDNYTRCGHDHS